MKKNNMKRRVLIVDDEVLVRIGIRHSIDWESCNFVIAGEASDGIECLRLTEQIQPDVIILDINMPNMDGIEVLKRIKEIGFPVKVIILTCYNELEYARKAMKYGASDYVLKTTINEDGLLNALNDLVFDDNEKDVRDDIINQQEMIKSVLHGFVVDTNKLLIRPNNLFCIGIKILDIQEVKERYVGKKEDFFEVSLLSLIKQVLTGIEESIIIQVETDMICVYLSFSLCKSSSECFIRIRQIAERLSWMLQQYMALNIRIGVSKVHYNFDDIKKSYNETCQAILEGIFKPEKIVFYYEENESNKFENEKKELEKELKKFVLDRRYEECLERIQEYYKVIQYLKGDALQTSLHFLEELVYLIDNVENEVLNSEDNLLLIDDFGEIREVVDNKIKSHIKSSDNYLINNAIYYLKEHYKEQISLGRLAEYMELSESYVSRLFNKETGINISSYINSLRITEAKNLLKNTNMKIYEIASETGYSSTTVFHIAFKKSEGITPAEYRNIYSCS